MIKEVHVSQFTTTNKDNFENKMNSTSTTQTTDMLEYKRTCLLADLSCLVLKDLRRGADIYLEATLKAPSKWAFMRWSSFNNFCMTVGRYPDQSGVEATQADKKALKSIARDGMEPNLFRASALRMLGRLKMKNQDFEAAANIEWALT